MVIKNLMYKKLSEDSSLLLNTSILNTAFYFLLISASLVSLFYYIGGLRLNLYDIFGFIYILTTFIFILFHQRLTFYKKNFIFIPILILVLIFLTELISSIGILISIDDKPSFEQFLKLLISSLLLKLILISFLLHQSIDNFKNTEKYLKFFTYFLVASCIYQYLAIYSRVGLGFSLDEIFWPIISLGSWDYDVKSLEFGSQGGAFSFTVRHGGFAGNPNFFASQLICAIPLTFYLASQKSSKFYFLLWIFVISMFATISRSGTAGMVLAFCLIFIRFLLAQPLSAIKYLLYFILFGFVLNFIGESFSFFSIVDLVDSVTRRMTSQSYVDSPRMLLVIAGFDMLSNSPIFGVGLGNAAVLLENYDIFRITGPSIHNYWVMILVERGLFVIPLILYYTYLFYFSFTVKNMYSKSMGISLFCLVLLGFFNTSLGSLQVQLYLLLLYCVAIKYNRATSTKY